MIALAPGGAGVLDGNTITRSTNLFGSLPAADATGALTGSSTTINLGAGGFTYLFAKYDGQNDISFVWNVAGLTGNVTIPQDGPLGHGLSGWVLFGGGGNGVPDGGATVMLLGASLGALGMLRRYLKS
jgi:VPDSG-CTERM motif